MDVKRSPGVPILGMSIFALESSMVAPALEGPITPPSRGADDPVLARLSRVVQRLDDVIEDGQATRARLDRLEMRLEETSDRHQRAIEQLERNVEEKMQSRLTESVKGAIQPELSVFRPPIEAQAARLAAVESRLERVETIQVESMNALDARFGDLAFQTRLALSAGGLVTLGAVMVVLLR